MSSFLFVYPQLKKLTGAERLIIKLADYATRLGHNVTVATHYVDEQCRRNWPADVGLAGTGPKLQVFGNHYLDASLEYLLTPRLIGRSGRAFDAAVFFGGPSLPALNWAKRVRRVSFPCLYFCYEPPRFAYTDTEEVAARLGALRPLARLGLPLYRLADGLLVRQADRLLVNGHFGRERVRQVYALDSSVITHGVDIPPVSSSQVDILRRRLLLDEGSPVAITVNHLHPRKRIDLFVRAMRTVVDVVPPARALIVGVGPEADRLRGLVRRLGLEQAVTFTGFIPEDELGCYYALASTYVNPAKMESFGLSVIEAMAFGVPVVSVAEGGPSETVADGRRGFLVDPTPSAIAEKITYLLHHPEEAREMGAEGKEYVERTYRWSDGAATLVEECLRLAASGKPGRQC